MSSKGGITIQVYLNLKDGTPSAHRAITLLKLLFEIRICFKITLIYISAIFQLILITGSPWKSVITLLDPLD